MEQISNYELDDLSAKQLKAIKDLSSCKNAENCLRTLMSIIDGQANCDEIKAFEDHIEQCDGCFKEYETAKTIKDMVAKSVKKRCCPDGLEHSITKKLNLAAQAG